MAAYSLYDVLRTLVERVGWPTETEKKLCLDSIAEAERMAIFGNLAQIMTCKHEHRHGNKCSDCGKIL